MNQNHINMIEYLSNNSNIYQIINNIYKPQKSMINVHNFNNSKDTKQQVINDIK